MNEKKNVEKKNVKLSIQEQSTKIKRAFAQNIVKVDFPFNYKNNLALKYGKVLIFVYIKLTLLGGVFNFLIKLYGCFY